MLAFDEILAREGVDRSHRAFVLEKEENYSFSHEVIGAETCGIGDVVSKYTITHVPTIEMMSARTVIRIIILRIENI